MQKHATQVVYRTPPDDQGDALRLAILLAKTYAHLLQDHKRAQAAQVVFGPVALAAEGVAS